MLSFYSIITDTITNTENQHIKKSKIKDTTGTALAKRKGQIPVVFQMNVCGHEIV